MNKTKESGGEKKLSPKNYSEFLKKLNLRDINLVDCKISAQRDAFGGRAGLSFDEVPAIVSDTENEVKISVTYRLQARSGRKRVFSIDAKYVVLFHKDTDIPKKFFDIYNELSLPLQVYPYFRELTHSLIARAGLPGLTLPLRKFLLPDK